MIAAAAVLVEHLLEQATEQRAMARSRFATAAGSNFTTASRFDDGATAVNRSDAAGGLASRSGARIAAAVVLVEEFLQQAAEFGAGAAARIDDFATASGFNDFAAAGRLDDFATTSGFTSGVTTAITQISEQAETGLSRAASEHKNCQHGGGDDTTHRYMLHGPRKTS